MATNTTTQKNKRGCFFYTILAFIIPALIALIGIFADFAGLGVLEPANITEGVKMIFGIKPAINPAFSKEQSKDYLTIVVTRFDDYGIKEGEESSTECFSRAIESAIGKIALKKDLRLLKVKLIKELCPNNYQQAIEIGNFHHADIVIWGKMKNMKEGCKADGIEINFETANFLNTWSGWSEERRDTSILVGDLSAYDIGDEFSILGVNNFHHLLQYYINKNIGVGNASKYKIPETLPIKEKVKWLHERADIYNFEDEKAMALRDYNKILEIDSKNEKALFMQLEKQIELDNNEVAFENAKKITGIYPNLAKSQYQLAYAYYYIKDDNENALKTVDKAIALDKANPTAFNLKANALFSLDRYKESIEYYIKSLDLEYNGDVVSNRARAYFYDEQYELAIEDYTKALTHQRDPEYYSNRSSSYFELGNDSMALLDMNHFFEYEKPSAEDLNYTGILYYNLEQYETSIKYYSSAIEKENKNAIFYLNRGTSYAELDNTEFAINDFDKSIELDSLASETYHRRAKVHEDLEAYDKMIIDCKKCLAIDSLEANCFNRLGLAETCLHNYDQGIDYFNQALRLDSTMKGVVYNNISFALTNKGRCEIALEFIDQSIQDKNDFPNRYKNKGRALHCLKKYKEAIVNFDKAIELDPTNQDYYGFRSQAKLKNWNLGGAYIDLINSKEGFVKQILKYTPFLLILLTLLFIFRKKIKNQFIPYLKKIFSSIWQAIKNRVKLEINKVKAFLKINKTEKVKKTKENGK